MPATNSISKENTMSDCIFCKIVSKTIPADIIKESNYAILIKDKSPKAPHHVLALPKEHAPHIGEVQSESDILETLALLCEYAYDNGLEKTGFRIIINSGKDAGQTVDHYHAHLLGGAKLKDDLGA
jgi:histidine triad (HIT) family protein